MADQRGIYVLVILCLYCASSIGLKFMPERMFMSETCISDIKRLESRKDRLSTSEANTVSNCVGIAMLPFCLLGTACVLAIILTLLLAGPDKGNYTL